MNDNELVVGIAWMGIMLKGVRNWGWGGEIGGEFTGLQKKTVLPTSSHVDV